MLPNYARYVVSHPMLSLQTIWFFPYYANFSLNPFAHIEEIANFATQSVKYP